MNDAQTNRREPHIQADHIDGPLLIKSDSTLHWLTPWERVLLSLGLTDATRLDAKHQGEGK